MKIGEKIYVRPGRDIDTGFQGTVYGEAPNGDIIVYNGSEYFEVHPLQVYPISDSIFRFTVQFILGKPVVSEIALVSWAIPPVNCVCVDSPDIDTAEARRQKWLSWK